MQDFDDVTTLKSFNNEGSDWSQRRRQLTSFATSLCGRIPPATAQIAAIFCLVPLSVAATILVVTFLVNFGVAFIAQAISTLAVLLVLIPCLAFGLTSALICAYALDLLQLLFVRLWLNPNLVTNPSIKLKIC
ncbi:unnamed protein product [Caenorhabditis auriculariae]|uniref:Uncharacterized protein n=1 Tax=Caenorhabditis auriculariae TaxID=2777116 RepID=A0A8S1HSK1_9PELO|nr:unnamed protein product [Caenorhabditis auriculariae]